MNQDKPHLQINQQAWNARVIQGKSHTRSVHPDHLNDPIKHIDPVGWLNGHVNGLKVLCLASGGGLQSVLYAKAGADVTVLDVSEEMLNKDRLMAKDYNLKIRTIHGTMEDLSIFPDAYFDLVVQPVSTCYVPDIIQVYREVAKVLKPEGLYISQHKQPMSLQASPLPIAGGYLITEPYYRSGPLPPPASPGSQHREYGTVEFLHRWECIIGGLCRQGFTIEDLLEPRHADSNADLNSFQRRSHYIPPYVLIKARRTNQSLDKSLIIHPAIR
jgi:2-polyprenyl-3-methyl-5-hydroxy-6-metoxy-1,4-benzoquinol methylase